VAIERHWATPLDVRGRPQTIQIRPLCVADSPCI
jgi:hypothetical protein